MKICPKCMNGKDSLVFYKDKSKKDGLSCWCKSCSTTRYKEWQKDNPEKANASTRKWQRKNSTKSKRWRVENQDKKSAYDRNWYLANQERKRATQQKWAEENQDKIRDSSALRRAKKRNAYVAPVDRREIFIRDGGRCHICKKLVNPNKWHLDHILPLAKNGTHEPRNVSVSHPKCNLQKHTTGTAQLRLMS